MNFKNKAFTLVEIMIWILIVTIVILSWFESFSKIWVWKINLVEKTNIQKDSFYFTEKIFQLIKEWGTLDYEEYFNRSVLGTTFSSWHYLTPSWFWNFWRWWTIWTTTYWNRFYYCISWNWIANKMSWNWCVSNFNTDRTSTTWANRNQNNTWRQQRYGQYSFQFIDYNSNYNSDFWDENSNLNIIWDDDDENLWIWPIPFVSWTDVKELYLISWDWKTRTFLRWNVIRDPDVWAVEVCSINASNVITWDWCRWTVEFLKLEWVDWWMDHNSSTIDSDGTQNDWVIDTWLIDKQFTWLTNADTANSIIAWSNNINYWKPLFPTSINVIDFKVYPFPNIENKYYWKVSSVSNNISPYVIINMKIKPSWEVRKKIKSNPPFINFNMTVNLTDIFSK